LDIETESAGNSGLHHMSAPAVSVLIPVFNGEPFLAECLDSILAQDFEDFEVLISDDCSTDGSAAVIRRYAERDGRIRWWTNPRNLGIGGNWNACLQAARADLIKFVFQDDKFLETSAMRRMAAALDGDPSLVLVASASQRIDASSQVLRLRNRLGESGVWDGKPLILHCLDSAENMIGEPSAAMFRKARAGRGFDARMVQMLDLEMWFHLLEQGRHAHIADPLCAFREHPGQQTVANSFTDVTVREHLMLADRYFARPWLKEVAGPREIFVFMYRLRRRYGAQADSVRAEMRKNISTPLYARCWLQYKISRPFQHFWRWLRERGVPA
jgi:glycosyltransferase involved in cell wall biosynthesis